MREASRLRGAALIAGVSVGVAICPAALGDGWGESSAAIDARARHLADRLVGGDSERLRPPYTSDTEHARTVDPVLTRGSALWIRENGSAGNAIRRTRVTAQGGRIFRALGIQYDPTDVRELRIRPIDDRQNIPFFVRVTVSPGERSAGNAVVCVTVPYPVIFQARLDRPRAWIGSMPAGLEVFNDLKRGELTMRVPLPPPALSHSLRTGSPVVIVIEGVLVMGPYPTVPVGAFGTLDPDSDTAEWAALAELAVGRDGTSSEDLALIRELARDVVGDAGSDFLKVILINRWVSTRISYQETVGSRSPLEVLEDGTGDCEDFTSLMVALLRAEGIPARRVNGDFYDLDVLVPHAWAEVALPLKSGGVHWFLCDPTLAHRAGTDEAKAGFVQVKSRVHMYSVQPMISVPGPAGRWSSDIFLSWREADDDPLPSGEMYDRFASLVIERVDGHLVRQAERVFGAGLTLRREYATLPGSRYLLGERQVPGSASAWWRMWLENRERLILELAAADESGLDSEEERMAINRMRAVYDRLSAALFSGVEAHRNLELVFDRDPHTDLLWAVRLRFGSFLLEHEGPRVVRRLRRGDLVTEDEKALLESLLDIMDGRNLYILQELARSIQEATGQQETP